jgi:hypothetical protein
MTPFFIVVLFVLAAWMLLGGVGSILHIGKKREPSTPGQAVFTVIVNGFFATMLIVLAVWGMQSS